MKKYLIPGSIIVFFGMAITIDLLVSRNRKLLVEQERLEQNNKALLTESQNQVTTLNLKFNEVYFKLKTERDSIAKSLQIKPKQVEKIIYIDNSTHDTVKVPVPVQILSKKEWMIRDSTRCLRWQGKAILQGDSLSVERQLLEWNDRTTQVFYRVRPHKFLFIKYGKWVNYQKISSECSNVKVQNFVFVK